MITLFVLTGILISAAVALPLVVLSLKEHRAGRYARPSAPQVATAHAVPVRTPVAPALPEERRAA